MIARSQSGQIDDDDDAMLGRETREEDEDPNGQSFSLCFAEVLLRQSSNSHRGHPRGPGAGLTSHWNATSRGMGHADRPLHFSPTTVGK